jgi:hypothetical protein
MIRVVLIVLLAFSTLANASISHNANIHKRELIRTARFFQGMDAPIALYGAQVEAESNWRYDAQSPYATGVSQFTDDTVDWTSDKLLNLDYPSPYNPKWSLRAMISYDLWLLSRVKGSDECNSIAKMLAAYNGGLTWIKRDEKLAEENGYDRLIWWDSVEHFSNRRKSAFKENRNYPRKILGKFQPMYYNYGWGHVFIECKELNNERKEK